MARIARRLGDGTFRVYCTTTGEYVSEALADERAVAEFIADYDGVPIEAAAKYVARGTPLPTFVQTPSGWKRNILVDEP